MAKQFETPALLYGYDALEPYIDKETMMIHHDKHHAAYTKKFNAALEGHDEWLEKSGEEILSNLQDVPEDIRMAVRNNGGGHVNHSLFWEIMGPDAGGSPEGAFAEALNDAFGDYKTFKQAFEEAASTQFGSGWAWLTIDGKKLVVEKTQNQDSPLTEGRIPILALDVWEHAYYLKYQNKRPDYISAFWNVVNWKAVTEKFEAARK